MECVVGVTEAVAITVKPGAIGRSAYGAMWLCFEDPRRVPCKNQDAPHQLPRCVFTVSGVLPMPRNVWFRALGVTRVGGEARWFFPEA